MEIQAWFPAASLPYSTRTANTVTPVTSNVLNKPLLVDMSFFRGYFSSTDIDVLYYIFGDL